MGCVMVALGEHMLIIIPQFRDDKFSSVLFAQASISFVDLNSEEPHPNYIVIDY